MASKYNSPFSVGKRQTIFIDPNDPRVRGVKAGITAARIGSEIKIINPELSQAGSFSYLKNAGVGASNPGLNPKNTDDPTKPGSITNLSAVWEDLASGPALVITFDFDFSNEQNKYVTSFGYYLTGSGTTTPLIETKTLNTSSTSQRIEFTYSDNAKYYGIFQTSFSLLEIAAYDSFGNPGDTATLTDIPSYENGLPAPNITVTSIIQGYSVNWDPIVQTYEYISVSEVVSDAATPPTSGYQEVYLDSIKPANVMTPTTETRWVKARFTDKAGTYGPYSNEVKVTPTNPVSADLVPPADVTAVSAAWSGDNVVISYTLPAADAGVRFQIALTAPNSSVGYFYVFPTGTSLNQTATITKADLFTQFGAYYSSFSGLIKSIDAADNKTAGVSFSVAARVNPLLGITPTFTLVALVNGYSVSFTLPQGATYCEVYQKYTNWVPALYQMDSFTADYLSGGASGTNTVTLSNIVDNEGNAVTTIPTGYRVIGDGIAANSYITSVSGNQITVNNNFESQVSGSITAYSVVYSGTSPANISSTIYEDTYILIRYYDDFGNASNYSAEQDVVPLSPVTVDISGPGNVSSSGMSTSAGIDNSGTLGFNGYINLSWNSVTDSSLRGYRIRFTTDTVDPVYSYVDYPIDQANPPTGTVSYKLAGLAVGATYKIAVATYDEYNNTSTSYVDFDDTEISGTPAITDYITAGNFQFGVGVDPSDTTGITGTKRGLFFDDSNYWFLNASDSARLKVGGSTSNYLLWNGTTFTIDGDITARGGEFSGNIELSTLGASIYNGDVTTSPGNLTGDGFIFNKDGLLIRKGSNQVSLDTTNGAITANAGNIAGWDITSSKIEKLNPSSTKYAGLSPSGTYAFWAGSTSAGGDSTQFAVDNTGKVYATTVQISGGTLDLGAPSTNLTTGFHVTTSGKMYSNDAEVTGVIKATSGEISGNFQVKSTGSFFAGNGTTDSVVINTDGLAALDENGAALTEILTAPLTSGPTPEGNTFSTLPGPINFFTKGALIGGWYVSDSVIQDRSEQFVLDSVNKNLTITGVIDVSTNFEVEIGTGSNVLSAGITGQTPNFSVTRSGILTAFDANLSGTLSITGSDMKFGNNVNSNNDGIYVSANNYWYDTGAFSFGGGILTGTSSSMSLNGGEINIQAIGTVETDSNNFFGDSTLTLNSSGQLVKGRRFIFNGTGNIPTDPTGWNSSTRTGTFVTNGGLTITVKTGDVLMIY